MVKAKSLPLQVGQIVIGRPGALQKLRVRLAHVLQQNQHAQILQQGHQKGLVAGDAQIDSASSRAATALVSVCRQ